MSSDSQNWSLTTNERRNDCGAAFTQVRLKTTRQTFSDTNFVCRKTMSKLVDC
jgi:hypothetical protein